MTKRKILRAAPNPPSVEMPALTQRQLSVLKVFNETAQNLNTFDLIAFVGIKNDGKLTLAISEANLEQMAVVSGFLSQWVGNHYFKAPPIEGSGDTGKQTN